MQEFTVYADGLRIVEYLHSRYLHRGVKMRPNDVRRLRIWDIEKAGMKVLIQHERSCG